MKHLTIKQALQYVANNPVPLTDEQIQLPVYELIARNLFDIANSPNSSVRGSEARANRARQIILTRLVGKRKPGTRPAGKQVLDIEISDLAAAPEVGA